MLNVSYVAVELNNWLFAFTYIMQELLIELSGIFLFHLSVLYLIVLLKKLVNLIKFKRNEISDDRRQKTALSSSHISNYANEFTLLNFKINVFKDKKRVKINS